MAILTEQKTNQRAKPSWFMPHVDPWACPFFCVGHLLYVKYCIYKANFAEPNWTNDTIDKIKRYTDRPIKLRHKPRGRGTSGPSEAKVPLSEDLKDAWCVVTSCSIAAVEAMCEGIPVFCHDKSFATDVAGTELSDIENPYYGGPEPWLYSCLLYTSDAADE